MVRAKIVANTRCMRMEISVEDANLALGRFDRFTVSCIALNTYDLIRVVIPISVSNRPVGKEEREGREEKEGVRSVSSFPSVKAFRTLY